MAKLHELLAVRGDTITTATKINAEAIHTFGKKDEFFIGTVTRSEHFAEDDKKLDTIEHKEMVTTVPEKLLYIVAANVRAIDTYYQVESANQIAHADIVVGDEIIAAKVPSTVLLGLETKLRDLRTVYAAIPTLTPGTAWVPDTEKRSKGGIYKSAHAITRVRTRKTMRPVVMAPATKEHPAQVQALQEDMPIGNIVQDLWSGMMSSADKSDLLGRVDTLLRAVKAARQRANSVTAEKVRLGQALFDFIHAGIVA